MAWFDSGKPHKPPWLTLLTIVLLALLAVFAVLFVRDQVQGQQEQAAFTALAALAAPAETSAPPPAQAAVTPHATGDPAPAEPSPQAQYVALYEQNSDFAGWLQLPGTEINLPVMYTPDDPEYYLHRAVDQTAAKSGTPFIGQGGSLDSACLIIYSHNMKNKTMFGTLDKYQEADFWAKNPTFSFDTLAEKREYEVFAAVETRILDQNETGFRYYNASGDLTAAQYQELTDWLRSQALYDTGIIPTYGEQIMLLSTCSYHTNNGRFIVAARRIR